MNLDHISLARPTKACIIHFQEGEREVWNGFYAPGKAVGALFGSMPGSFVFFPGLIVNPYLRLFVLVVWLTCLTSACRCFIEVGRFFIYANSLTTHRLIVYNRRKGVVVGEIPLSDIECRKLRKIVDTSESSELWLIPKEPSVSEKWPFRCGDDRRVPGIADPTLLYALIGELQKNEATRSSRSCGDLR